MQNSFQTVLSKIAKTTGDLWTKGWAEANAGNISIRLEPGTCDGQSDFEPRSDWVALDMPFPNLANDCILITGTGAYLRNVPLEPQENLGVIQLDASGAGFRLLWGHTFGDRPTSELPAHVRAHSVRKRISGGADCAVLHTHPPNLVAMTHALELDTARLSKLLWQMHPECIILFPDGIEVTPWMVPGSLELAKATARGLEKRRSVFWQFHGIVATGPTLDAAFGLIDAAESASEVYMKAAGAGGVTSKLSDKQLHAIVEAFSLQPDEAILNSQI